MPSDPKALLALGAKVNGLQNASTAPWHLKATYDVLDDKGVVKETGHFEEFWVSDKLDKRSYSSPSFNQTDFSSEAGVLRSGSPDWPNEAAAAARRSLFPAFPSNENLEKRKVKLKDKMVGGIVLKCAIAESVSSISLPSDFLYCFSKDAPILRISLASSGLYEEVYNRISLFRGVYVAHDVNITRFGKPFLRVQVDVLDTSVPYAEVSQVAPLTAIPINRRSPLHCDADVAVATRKVPPRYPTDAKSARVQGVVYLGAVIDQDGKVAELRPITGPPMLIDSSIEAVRQWMYNPCLVDGEPFEVETVVRVVYALGH